MEASTIHALRAIRANEELGKMKSMLRAVKRQAENLAETIGEYKPPECTGYYALFREVKGQPPIFLGIFNPDIDDEEPEVEWDIALSIPTAESLKEFTGW